jgi:hypothetical protein
MFISPDAPRFGKDPDPATEESAVPIVHDPVPAGMEPDPEPASGETAAPAPELTRTTRVAGHEVADKLRQERRVKRLEEKGY